MTAHNLNDVVRMMESITKTKGSRWRKLDEHHYRRRMRNGYACTVTEHMDDKWTGRVVIESRRPGRMVSEFAAMKSLGPFATAREAKRAADDAAWEIGAKMSADAIGHNNWSLVVVSGKTQRKTPLVTP